jgi:hypothetical protein
MTPGGDERARGGSENRWSIRKQNADCSLI